MIGVQSGVIVECVLFFFHCAQRDIALLHLAITNRFCHILIEMKPLRLFLLFLLACIHAASAQTLLYDVVLFGKKIGASTIERIDNGNGEVRYKLSSQSSYNNFLVNRTSQMQFDVVYRNGKLFSAYCKNVKNEITEITTVLWDGMKYVISKGEETLQVNQLIDFSAIQLYFSEPAGRTRIFSERLGAYCTFEKEGNGEYICELENGVDNIYRYRNGVLYELEMSKGASVYMRLVQ